MELTRPQLHVQPRSLEEPHYFMDTSLYLSQLSLARKSCASCMWWFLNKDHPRLPKKFPAVGKLVRFKSTGAVDDTGSGATG